MTTNTLETLVLEPNKSYNITAPVASGKTRALLKAVAVLAIQLDKLNQDQVIRFVSDEHSPVDLANLYQEEILKHTEKTAQDLKPTVFFSSREAQSKEAVELLLSNNQFKKIKAVSTAFDVLVLDIHSDYLAEDEIRRFNDTYDIEIIQSYQSALGTEPKVQLIPKEGVQA